jgi:hypothetical protein
MPDMGQALADLRELNRLSIRFGFDLANSIACITESGAPVLCGEIDHEATEAAGNAVVRFKLAEHLRGALAALRARNGNGHIGHEITPEITPEMIMAGTEFAFVTLQEYPLADWSIQLLVEGILKRAMASGRHLAHP